MSRWARRSNASAYVAHRTGHVDQQHHAARLPAAAPPVDLAPARPSGAGCAAASARRRPGRGASAGAAPYGAAAGAGGASRTSRRDAASPPPRARRRRGAAAPRWRWPRADRRRCRSSSPPSPTASVSGSSGPGGRDRRRRTRPGQAVAGVEERLEDRVVARSRSSGPAQSVARPATVGRALVVEPEQRGGLEEAVGAVLGDRYAGRPQRAGEAEQDLVGRRRPWRHRGGHVAQHLVEGVADPVGVLAVLHQRPERAPPRRPGRARRCRGGAAPAPSRGSRRRRAAWQVVAVAQLLHDGDHLAGQLGRHLGRAGADDLDLALEARVVDPVVEAAPLERVVQLAGAVGGEHHERRGRGRHRAELGERHLLGRQHLEQERLELVVGPVDLVDQQHRGALLERWSTGRASRNRASYRLFSASSTCPRRRRPPRARAGAGSGGGSPSRTGPAWRRCPRSTGAGSAAARATRRWPRRARSCRCRARPRAAAAAASAGRGTSPWPGRASPR